jgi:5-methylcytosine-specific restriction endonuclease McrA
MISQPVTADINNLSICCNSSDNFAISYTPYLDVLRYIIQNNSMSSDEYKYIVSRKKHTIKEDDWRKIEPEIKSNLDDIKNTVNSFGRQGDIRDEDSRKELLKYLLGIRCDLNFDKGTNPFDFVEFPGKTVICKNKDKLVRVYSIYSKLNDYKIQKYHNIFERCEDDLKKRYIASCSGKSVNTNARTKIDWDLYNIHLDKFILLGILTCLAITKCKYTSAESLTNVEKGELIEYCRTNFSTLLKCIGLKTKTDISREINKFLAAIIEEDYTYFSQVENNREEITAHYHATNAKDLLERIERVSAQATVENAENRDRNTNLISLLKSYYLQCYLENRTLRCECCNEETFVTDADIPYVEFHHLIPFNIAYGPDHYLNLFALCPNCHRKMHFLNLDDKGEHYQKLNVNNYMHISFVDRLLKLKKENLLRSYHLEYLLADKAISEDEYNKVIAA